MDFFWRWQLQLTKASVFVNGAELCMRDCAKRWWLVFQVFVCHENGTKEVLGSLTAVFFRKSFLVTFFMVRLENWQLVNLVCTWRNFRKFLNFFLLLVEDGFRCLEIRRNPLASCWLAGWSFFFLLFFSWLRLHGSSRENLADRGFGLWRCISTASFLSFLV